MMWMKSLWRRVRGLWRAEAINHEIDEEIQFHIDMRTEENIGRGMSPEEARRDAERRFGNPTRIKERGYEVRGGRWLEAFWQDLRFGARILIKKPGFTLVAVITLALGIGANSTIFSFANGILLRPLPYQHPERLVLLDETAPKRGVSSMGVSFPNFLDWREQNHVFEDVGAYGTGNYTLVGVGEPEQMRGARLSSGLLEILGVAPVLGRTIRPEEDRPDNNTVVILGHGLWQSRFGSNPGVVGQTVILNNRPHTIIGVMPPGFKFPEVADLWLPLALDTRSWTRNDHGLSALARLKPGVTLAQARDEMISVARRI